MNKPTREEVERWLRDHVCCLNSDTVLVPYVKARDIRKAYLSLLDENERQEAVVEAARIFAHDIHEANRKQLFEALAGLDGGSDGTKSD